MTPCRALMQAINNMDFLVVHVLLMHKVTREEQATSELVGALHQAVEIGQGAITLLLLDHGFDVKYENISRIYDAVTHRSNIRKTVPCPFADRKRSEYFIGMSGRRHRRLHGVTPSDDGGKTHERDFTCTTGQRG